MFGDTKLRQETREVTLAHGAHLAALSQLLVAKGVFTAEEWNAEVSRQTAYFDQVQAEADKRAREEFAKQFPNLAKFKGTTEG